MVSRNEGYIQNQVSLGVSDEAIVKSLIAMETIPERMSVEELTRHLYGELDLLLDEALTDAWGYNDTEY